MPEEEEVAPGVAVTFGKLIGRPADPRSAATGLVEQARFKPDELEKAENDRIFSRFMISPIRPADPDNTLAVQYPIASGTLGGFGAFLNESFRRHDYLLGRRNAQAFLRWNFALPETNPLFRGYDVRPW